MPLPYKTALHKSLDCLGMVIMDTFPAPYEEGKQRDHKIPPA